MLSIAGAIRRLKPAERICSARLGLPTRRGTAVVCSSSFSDVKHYIVQKNAKASALGGHAHITFCFKPRS